MIGSGEPIRTRAQEALFNEVERRYAQLVEVTSARILTLPAHFKVLWPGLFSSMQVAHYKDARIEFIEETTKQKLVRLLDAARGETHDARQWVPAADCIRDTYFNSGWSAGIERAITIVKEHA